MNCTLPIPTLANILARVTLSKFQLAEALFHQNSVHDPYFLKINGYGCILQSIGREDGSGSSFNLIISYQGKQYRCYCRTLD